MTWDFTKDEQLIEAGWVIIANVDWDHQNKEWVKAAEIWRDGYHEWLDRWAGAAGDRGFPMEPGTRINDLIKEGMDMVKDPNLDQPALPKEDTA